MTAARSVTAAVLRNRGVPVRLHVLDEHGERVFVDDEPQYEEKFIAFTNDVLADVEAHYSDLDGWEDALNTQPRRALSTTFAFLLGWITVSPETGLAVPDARRAGRAMIETETAAYSTAVGVAFMVAEGVPVEAAGEVLAAGLRDVEEGKTKMSQLDVKKLLSPDDEVSAALPDTPTDQPDDTTGPPSTPGGSDTGSTPSSSGDSVPPRSDS